MDKEFFFHPTMEKKLVVYWKDKIEKWRLIYNIKKLIINRYHLFNYFIFSFFGMIF